jgi:septum site-determining protein MinD
MEQRTKVIVLLSNKGGTGKTFIASNLGVAFAQMCPGENVIMVDVDPGSRTTSMLLGPSTTPRKDIFDFFRDPEVLPEDAVVRSSVMNNLLVMPNVRGFEPHPSLKNKELLRKKLSLLLQFFDDHTSFAIIDLPAGKTTLHYFFSLVGTCYLVVRPTQDSLTAGEQMIGTLSNLAMKTLKRDERLIDGVIANAVIRGEEEKVRNFFKKHGVEVVQIVPYSPAVEEAIERWECLVTYKPDDPAAIAIRQLAAKIAGREGWEDISVQESRDRRGGVLEALRRMRILRSILRKKE